MLAHHAAAMPIIQSGLNGGTSPVRVLAQTMRIDQTLGMRWIDGSLAPTQPKA
jgi:hypothetical protein